MDKNEPDGFILATGKTPAFLPVSQHKDSLLFLIEKHAVTIVAAATGSGKTTQIPQFLAQAGWCENGKMIAVTQPRRIAATTVAAHVANEMNCALGSEVGYSIRFDDLSSKSTMIKFMTDGMLLREALVDPLLSRYSIIMVDEAHERSIGTDVLLGILKKILKKRPELRVVISSATLQTAQFKSFFNYSQFDKDKTSTNPTSSGPNCTVIGLDGRSFSIDIMYLENPTANYLNHAIQTALDIHQKELDGDILVFLTGREDIETAIKQITQEAVRLPTGAGTIVVLPMYAGLSLEQQHEIFEPTSEGSRKIILSTNIAEASVTIEGIVFVIDSGFVKLRSYNATTGIETLTATPISKASANQRAGRAGRTRPGKCYRLYTESDYKRLSDVTVPEIQRSNLAPTILQLKALGVDNVARFDYLTRPPSELMKRGLELLFSLGAVDEYARLTKPLGVRMAELAIDPMMSKTLLISADFGCLDEILTIAAMMSVQSTIWSEQSVDTDTSRAMFAAQEGDHLTLLNLYNAFTAKGGKEAAWCRKHSVNYRSMINATNIQAQLKRNMERYGLSSHDQHGRDNRHGAQGHASSEQIRRCLTAGYFAHSARMQPDGTYRTTDSQTILHAHPSSLMFNRKADWALFHEATETGSKTFIHNITVIEKSWLLEYGANYYHVPET